MRIPSFRTAAIVIAAGIGLGGCAYNSPFGYGSGVSVGYGNGDYYDPYYSGYSNYGYGSPYGYSSGYGYSPYWGWNNGFYYPGSGYYVYDRYRRPRVLTEAERRYWAERASRAGSTTTRKLLDNWSDFAQGGQVVTQSTQTTRAVRNGGRTIRVRSSDDTNTSAVRTRSERASTRSERAATRERPSSRSERSSSRNRDEANAD